LLRRVFARDALRCPRCSSRMRILAQIHPPDTARAILDRPGLASRAPPRVLARAEPDPLSFPGPAAAD
jgi:DNA-directed RNA polymerase subunit RPC12/RpoP